MDASEAVGIGTPLSRVDGVAKVTGVAKYAAEYEVPDLLYGVTVVSKIARGQIVSIDERLARLVPGVVDIISHVNRPHHAWLNRSWKDELAIPGKPFRAFHNADILFAAQPIALVVAETFEAARFAASLVEVAYDQEPHNIEFAASLAEKFLPGPGQQRNIYHPPVDHGDAESAYRDAELQHEGEYHLAVEHHMPMEMHASTEAIHSRPCLPETAPSLARCRLPSRLIPRNPRIGDHPCPSHVSIYFMGNPPTTAPPWPTSSIAASSMS